MRGARIGWRLALSAALSLSFVGRSSAEVLQVRTDLSQVQIQVEAPFPVRSGYAPLRVEIRNFDDREHIWSLDFTSQSAGTLRRTRSRLAVPGGESRLFELVVPLASDVGQASSLLMRVEGFGVQDPGGYPLGSHAYDQSPALWIAFSQSLPVDRERPAGVTFTSGRLPSDWRAYKALGVIAVSEDDWKRLSQDVRTGLQEWAAQGGRLLRLGEGEVSSEPLGLGSVVRAARPSSSAEWSALLAGTAAPAAKDYAHWPRGKVAPIETKTGLLLLFLVGYALTIGPLNLFVLSPSGKRMRLFWTMPAIALVATLFLAILIVLQDGFGGEGRRITFVRLVPEITREVVVQEQVSRTGALLGRTFDLSGPVALFDTPLEPNRLRGELSSAAATFGGNWFRSRARQGQRLETVRPARARLERNRKGEILSSIEEPLETLYYRDLKGRSFRARNVTPGSAASLEPVAEQEFEAFWRELAAQAEPVTSERLQWSYRERGGFLARAGTDGNSRGGSIDTLDAIVWEDLRVYSGRVDGRSEP